MNVLAKSLKAVLSFVVLLIVVRTYGVRFDEFEGRRPIKYFFHLLELKSGKAAFIQSSTLYSTQ